MSKRKRISNWKDYLLIEKMEDGKIHSHNKQNYNNRPNKISSGRYKNIRDLKQEGLDYETD